MARRNIARTVDNKKPAEAGLVGQSGLRLCLNFRTGAARLAGRSSSWSSTTGVMLPSPLTTPIRRLRGGSFAMLSRAFLSISASSTPSPQVLRHDFIEQVALRLAVGVFE